MSAVQWRETREGKTISNLRCASSQPQQAGSAERRGMMQRRSIVANAARIRARRDRLARGLLPVRSEMVELAAVVWCAARSVVFLPPAVPRCAGATGMPGSAVPPDRRPAEPMLQTTTLPARGSNTVPVCTVGCPRWLAAGDRGPSAMRLASAYTSRRPSRTGGRPPPAGSIAAGPRRNALRQRDGSGHDRSDH